MSENASLVLGTLNPILINAFLYVRLFTSRLSFVLEELKNPVNQLLWTVSIES